MQRRVVERVEARGFDHPRAIAAPEEEDEAASPRRNAAPRVVLASGAARGLLRSMAKLAFLGTGLIGAGLAEGAARRGDEVVAWNRSPEKAKALAYLGVRVAATPAEAVESAERVHVALSDDAAVDAVIEAALPGLRGATIFDHSTTSPAGTSKRAERLAAAGVSFLHCPVFMSPKLCREAGGVMLAAGPKATFEAAQKGLATMTGKLEWLGERPDLAAAYKLFGNAMILTITAGLSDVYTMASTLGIAATDAHKLFSIFNPGMVIGYRGANMARGDYAPSFELTMARKDARLMLEVVEGTDDAPGPLVVLPAVAERMDALLTRGLGDRDLGVLSVDAVPPKAR
jgi:3-hydroxyisobutyrate dehydrogenase